MRDPISQALTVSTQLALMPFTWWQMWWAASETVAYRLSMLALAGNRQDARTRRESARMVDEKVAAAWDSARVLSRAGLWQDLPPPLALWRQWQTGLESGAALYSAWLRETQRWQWPLAATARLVQASSDGVEPWRRRVVANAARLRRNHRRH